MMLFQVKRSDWIGGLCALLSFAAVTAATAAPPQGKGGSKSAPNCVEFTVGGDVQGVGGNQYCDDERKVDVKFSQAPHHLTLDTSTQSGRGREIYINFGTDVTLANGQVVQTTADPSVASTTARITVGAFQDDFDFFDPDGDGTLTSGESSSDVNVMLRVALELSDGSSDSLLIRMAPNPIGNNRHCGCSDDATVTYGGEVDGLHTWTVATNGPDACITRSGGGLESGVENCFPRFSRSAIHKWKYEF